MKNRIIVISPSGNLYGSEQVLCDYLEVTSLLFDVRVPEGSVLHQKLRNSRHRIRGFRNVKTLYGGIVLDLLAGRYDVVYVNEGGHSRYIQLLARLFPKVRFVVHVRMIEDTQLSRWGKFVPSNLKIITISEYLRSCLATPSILIYDLFKFPGAVKWKEHRNTSVCRVAIVGRVCYSKGFDKLVALCQLISKDPEHDKTEINVYGHIMEEVVSDIRFQELKHLAFVHFRGYVSGGQIYASNDVVLHLSEVEALGRIYFEALTNGLPLIGINAGGIGEIATKIGLSDHMVAPGLDNISLIKAKLEEVFETPEVALNEKLEKAFQTMKRCFSVENYKNGVDDILVNRKGVG